MGKHWRTFWSIIHAIGISWPFYTQSKRIVCKRNRLSTSNQLEQPKYITCNQSQLLLEMQIYEQTNQRRDYIPQIDIYSMCRPATKSSAKHYIELFDIWISFFLIRLLRESTPANYFFSWKKKRYSNFCIILLKTKKSVRSGEKVWFRYNSVILQEQMCESVGQ